MRSKLSGVQIPTAAKLNIDGEFTLDASAGTPGQIIISQGSGNTPAWTSSPTFTTLTADQVLATNNGNGTNFKVGDDVWLGDINVANTMSLKGQQSATSGYIRFGGDANAFGYDGTKLSYAGNLTTSGLTLSSTTSPIILNSSAGTSGQILISAGAGATPTWTNTLTSPTIDVINAASASGTTADLFGNVTTGTVGIADGMTTGTLNLANGSVTNTSGRTVNINTNASGTMTVTTNIGSNVLGGQINLTAGASGGVTITGGGLTLAAGTSTPVIPLKFTANSSTPTATAGGMDYDGLFYAAGSSAKRGLIQNSHIYSLTASNTLTTTAGTKSVFGVSLALEANIVYEFEIWFGLVITCSNSGTNSTVSLSLALPTGASGSYQSQTSTGLLSTAPTQRFETNVSTPLATAAVTYSATAATLNGQYRMKGIVRTAGTTGNFTPNVVLTNSTNAPTAFSILAGSYVKVTKIGAANANINIGAWA